MNVWGRSSRSNLATADALLQKLAGKVLKIKDHSVIKGHRGQREQDAALAAGHSKVRWPNGKHNALPSKAIDVRTYPPPPRNDELIEALDAYIDDHPDPMLVRVRTRLEDQALREEQLYLLGLYRGVAEVEGIPIRTGADWDRDGEISDNGFDDFFHVELDEP